LIVVGYVMYLGTTGNLQSFLQDILTINITNFNNKEKFEELPEVPTEEICIDSDGGLIIIGS